MNNIVISAAGMVTPLGFNFKTSTAALRAGIDAGEEVNIWDAANSSYISGCKVHLPQWWEGRGKMVDLVAPAIWECVQAASPVPLHEIPILLGVSTRDRPFRFEGMDNQLLLEVEAKLGIGHHKYSRTLPDGRVSGFLALQQAQELIAAGAPCCIVSGVDSFLHQELGNELIKEQRILTENNSNGFVPGEAGAAVLVTPPYFLKNVKRFFINGIGYGLEKGTIDSDEPLSGDGITEAVRQAMSNAGVSYFDVDYRMTDLNGEHYKFFEAQILEGRVGRKYDDQGINRDKFRDMWHPIEYLGEVGAAIGPLIIGWAYHAAIKNYAPGDCVLFHVSNDDGRRAAAIARYES